MANPAPSAQSAVAPTPEQIRDMLVRALTALQFAHHSGGVTMGYDDPDTVLREGVRLLAALESPPTVEGR